MPRGINYTPNDCDRLRLADGLAYGAPIQQIADRIGVPERTLRRHYAETIRAAEVKQGRSTFEPTDEHRKIVLLAAAVGLPHDDIGRLIGCSDKTVEKYFDHELTVGFAQAHFMVAGTLFRAATGDPGRTATALAAIFWLKCRAGWRAASAAPRATDSYARREPDVRLIIGRPDNDPGDAGREPIPLSELSSHLAERTVSKLTADGPLLKADEAMVRV